MRSDVSEVQVTRWSPGSVDPFIGANNRPGKHKFVSVCTNGKSFVCNNFFACTRIGFKEICNAVCDKNSEIISYFMIMDITVISHKITVVSLFKT